MGSYLRWPRCRSVRVKYVFRQTSAKFKGPEIDRRGGSNRRAFRGRFGAVIRDLSPTQSFQLSASTLAAPVRGDRDSRLQSHAVI